MSDRFVTTHTLNTFTQSLPNVLRPPADLDECEPGWDKFQGFCYHHFTKRLSWEASEQQCRVCGGHLISVMTPEEQDYINGKTQNI